MSTRRSAESLICPCLVPGGGREGTHRLHAELSSDASHEGRQAEEANRQRMLLLLQQSLSPDLPVVDAAAEVAKEAVGELQLVLLLLATILGPVRRMTTMLSAARLWHRQAPSYPAPAGIPVATWSPKTKMKQQRQKMMRTRR